MSNNTTKNIFLLEQLVNSDILKNGKKIKKAQILEILNEKIKKSQIQIINSVINNDSYYYNSADFIQYQNMTLSNTERSNQSKNSDYANMTDVR